MSPLQSLAPDQRAVLELLLRQGRSYAELSELLGLPEDAVRDRAHAALAALAPDRAAPIGEDGAVADWILGQQDDAEAARTSEAIARMPAWRSWASDVTDRLGEVDGAHVPAVPAAEAGVAAPAPAKRAGTKNSRRANAKGVAKPAPAAKPTPAAKPEPAATGRPRPLRDGAGDASARSRTRPVRESDAAPAAATAGGGVAGLRSSRLGGAILIGVLALLLAGFLVWFLTRGDDSKPSSGASASASATATPTATPDVVAEVPLKGPAGTKPQGLMRVFKRDDGKLVFALAADKMPPNRKNEVYAVWFTKKGVAPRNLGFARTQVGKKGVFTTGGPQQGQENAFAGWLTSYAKIVVARAAANTASAKQPGQVVLQGTLPGGQ